MNPQKEKEGKERRWGRSLLLIGFRVIVLPHPTPNTLSFLLFHPSFLLVRSFIFFFFCVLNKGHGRWGRAPSSDQVQVSLSVASDNSSSLLVLLDYSSLLELLAYVSNDATRHLAEVLSSHALAVSAAINLSKLPNTNALLEVNTSGYTGSTDEIPVRVIRGQLLVGTSLDQVHVSTRLQLSLEVLCVLDDEFLRVDVFHGLWCVLGSF